MLYASVQGLRLRGVRYAWRADAPGAARRASAADIGFIAQELEQVLPELVVNGSAGYKAIVYNGVVPVLVEGVKAQQQTIDQLRTENAALEARVASLEASVARILAAVDV